MTHDLESFETYAPSEPDEPQLREVYADLKAQLGVGFDLATVAQWEAVSASASSWSSWASVRFHLDTDNVQHQERNARANELRTLLTQLDVDVKTQLLSSDHREESAKVFSARTLAGWQADADSYHPSIDPDLTEEKRLVSEYQRVCASARVEVGGRVMPMASLRPFAVHSDRAVREEACRARFTWYAAHQETFDQLFDDLVRVRTSMARKLGDTNHVALGYRRMGRSDFGPDEVAVFRAEIADVVVPLVSAYREQQATRIGVDRVRLWDEDVLDLGDAPQPVNLAAAIGPVFDAVLPNVGAQYREMTAKGLIDLLPRPGKADGGFATTLDGGRWPFIFANAPGTATDVAMLLHEMGHAYQLRTSALTLPRQSDWWPNMETAEVHSMTLELLALPHVGPLFGSEEESQRFAAHHLVGALLILPYTAAVDHFQHDVYEHPEATPDERAEMWRACERLYLPWRDDPDVPCVADGRSWQRQPHIYFMPFYYIDYALARTVSLQLWNRATHDRTGTLKTYDDLCALGGRVGLRELCAVAGVHSPFEPGCLASVVEPLSHLMGQAPADPST